MALRRQFSIIIWSSLIKGKSEYTRPFINSLYRAAISWQPAALAGDHAMGVFVTSVGMGDGANLEGSGYYRVGWLDADILFSLQESSQNNIHS
jgi:hypothetical protein